MERTPTYGPGGKLYPSEKDFLDCAARGGIWHPKAGKFPDGNCTDFQDAIREIKSENGRLKSEAFIIRPEVIRCLITGTPWDKSGFSPHHKPWPLHARGVLIANAWIPGDLQLDGCTLLGQLWLVKCDIAGFVNLQDAHAKTLGFSGTHIQETQPLGSSSDLRRAFNGRRLDVDGDVFLRDGFQAEAVVSLAKAKIHGSLHCEGGIFSAHKDALKVKHKAGTSASDKISHAPGDTNGYVAIDCSAAEIHGNVLFSNGFKALGGVDFSYARIDGGLRCTDGTFQSLYQKENAPEKTKKSDGMEYIALNCSYAHIGGNVSLMCGYTAEGSTEFKYARIGQSVHCVGGNFLCCIKDDEYDAVREKYQSYGDLVRSDYDALGFYGVKVEGALYLSKVACVKGTIFLQKAEVHGLHDDGTAWLDNPCVCFVLSGFSYHYAIWKSKFRPCTSCQERDDCKFGDQKEKRPVPETGDALAELVHRWLQNQPRVRQAGFRMCHTALKITPATRTYLDHPTREKSPENLAFNSNTRSWVQASRVMRSMGERKAARHLSYLREKYRTDLNPQALSRILRRVFLESTVGYGYKPHWALRWICVMIVLGWFVFATAGNYGYMSPMIHKATVLTVKAGAQSKAYPRFNALVYTLDSILPVVELGQTSVWEPTSEHVSLSSASAGQVHFWGQLRGQGYLGAVDRLPGWAEWFFACGGHRILFWFEIIFGWFLVTVGIANFSRIFGSED